MAATSNNIQNDNPIFWIVVILCTFILMMLTGCRTTRSDVSVTRVETVYDTIIINSVDTLIETHTIYLTDTVRESHLIEITLNDKGDTIRQKENHNVLQKSASKDSTDFYRSLYNKLKESSKKNADSVKQEAKVVEKPHLSDSLIIALIIAMSAAIVFIIGKCKSFKG